MRELPILCKDSVALNIREGRQTQHRVPVKGIPSWNHNGRDIMDWGLSGCFTDEEGRHWLDVQTDVDDNSRDELKAPWSVGDLLYVRECWRAARETPPDYVAYEPQVFIQYRSDETYNNMICSEHFEKTMALARKNDNWRPSIHMPKWASRTRLKVTRVWVERVQDISRGDCMSEGCPFPNLNGSIGKTDPRKWFCELWDSIYGEPKKEKPDYSWKANPWVWAVSFERIENEKM